MEGFMYKIQHCPIILKKSPRPNSSFFKTQKTPHSFIQEVSLVVKINVNDFLGFVVKKKVHINMANFEQMLNIRIEDKNY
jgi:hypothetical protein